MSQFIEISTPVSAPNANNISLIMMLKYIGKEYKMRHSNQRIEIMTNLNAGIEWVNKRCKKHHKKALKRIIFSTDKKTQSNTEYRRWRFHRRKVKSILFQIYQILRECNAHDEILAEFKKLYNQLNNNYEIRPLGGDIVVFPYMFELDEATSDGNRPETDRKAMKRITDSFRRFDSLYPVWK